MIHSDGNDKMILFEEAVLVFEGEDLNVEWYVNVVQDAIQHYWVTYNERKRATIQSITGLFFFQEGR